MAELLEDVNLPESLDPEEPKESISEFATIAAVYDDGVTLKFDGEDSSGEKRYQCNLGVLFRAGDRVSIKKQSGSYVVEYVVGHPLARYPIPAGGTTGQALFKNSDDHYDLIWGDIPSKVPTGGTQGQILMKNSGQDYDLAWTDVPKELPDQGTRTYGKYLQSLRSGLEWTDISGVLPTGGSAGQFLLKASTRDYDFEWKTLSSLGFLPAGGSVGQFLKKSTFSDYACTWASISEYSGPTINGSGTTTIGFFGTTATTRKTVNKISTYTTADAGTNRTKINEILTALISYGIITGY